MSFGLEPLYKQITDLEKQLKDAQKEITDCQEAIEGLENALAHERDSREIYTKETNKIIVGYKAKIEAAKPLLEKWCKECGEGEYENTCENDCTVHDLKALLFPRKEEGEK
jgi:predicted  nucleic acid-binding Zn-ribbon protein